MDARTTRAYLTLRTHPNTTGDHKPRPSHNVTTSNIRVFRLNVCVWGHQGTGLRVYRGFEAAGYVTDGRKRSADRGRAGARGPQQHSSLARLLPSLANGIDAVQRRHGTDHAGNSDRPNNDQ